ncbi:hypothetical protein BC939DRAFT_463855 [Gamsiella multidivaricata]|uniref:uncharacterized protein n=1 Tax=Gamsiella multidivaricata TaxID=101098 RepID=UPI00222129E2|nr:uncharacterized protein BC939DRAFT_463855 [Gamsiella multidivaricata]KAI7818163.1 hypothetical protein BC939DRAFT_463855 [Gamsiella multidivaricata]
MGIFNKPLLPAHYENEDVQISAELCPNIAINVVGLAKGEITILSGHEDMIQIKTSVQAKEAIIKNAAALEPIQDGNQYTYTIHTPLEEKLEKAVTFQVFVTIPRHLDSLESFTIEGVNVELAIGNISHTFIRHLTITTGRGDISIDNFYGEIATITNTISGGIRGKYSVARLFAIAKSGRISADAKLLNTDDQVPSPKVICSTTNFRIDLNVDGTDLFGPFTVEAKTQCSPLEAKVLLASKDQKVLGNFINFGGATRIRLSGNYQGRIETRTHYGKIYLEEPEFIRLEGATLTLPSLSDRTVPTLTPFPQGHQPRATNGTKSSSSAVSHHSNVISSRTSSHGTAMSWGEEQSPTQVPHNGHVQQPPSPKSMNGSVHGSKAESTDESLADARSVSGHSWSEKQRKKEEEKDSVITREMIGVIGEGPGLIMAKNSSGDIFLELI